MNTIDTLNNQKANSYRLGLQYLPLDLFFDGFPFPYTQTAPLKFKIMLIRAQSRYL